MPSIPQDPFTQLQEAAASAHEMHLALTTAGFSDAQALYLVGQAIAATIQDPA